MEKLVGKQELEFRKFDGTKIENVNQYVKDFLKEYPYTNLIVGCDSQQHSRFIQYAVSILMHIHDESGSGKGCHVIYATVKDYSKNIRSDIYTKLWSEVVYAVDAAKLIEDCGQKISIHLDYNSDKSAYSHILYDAGLGYALASGFKAYGKPDGSVASIVADYLCR